MSEIPIGDAQGPAASHKDSVMRRIQPALTMVIAFAAIGLATWEGVENRRHNRLVVKPHVAGSIDSGHESTGEYVRMAVESTGLGPAVVQTFRVYLDGVPQDKAPWRNAIATLSTSDAQTNARSFGKGYYFPAGRQYVLFEARLLKANPVSEKAFAEIAGRLAIQICYCSIYNTDCDEVLLTTASINALPCTTAR